MYRKIVYIVICCLFFRNVNAQQEKVLLLLNKIRAGVDTVLTDTALALKCKQNIEKLKIELPSRKTDSISDRKIQFLINTGRRFIAFHDTAGNDCPGEKIDTLVITTNQLIGELRKLANTPRPIQKDSIAKITILAVDSATKNGVSARLAIDSLGKPITGFKLTNDSARSFVVLLVLNRHYTISVTADQYTATSMEYTVKKNVDTLMIGLKHADATAIIKDPDPPVIEEDPVPVIPKPTVSISPFVWYTMIILLILLGIVAILYFNILAKTIRKANGKRISSIINPVSVFQKEIDRKQAFIQEINNNLEVVESSLAQITQKQQAMDLQPQKTESEEIPGTPDRYFLCEIMMTAGPRKKFMNEPFADKDLGEDVCGFISTSGEVLIWLLDGTSDEHCLINPENNREYFSSRLQAQCIAEKLRKHFGEMPAATLDGIISQAIQSVKSDWLKVIGQLPETEIQRLRTNIANQNFPECSSTLLLGKLQINGDFTGYRSGDSKLLLFNTKEGNKINFAEKSLVAKNPQSNDRTFFRIQFDENNNFDILCNEPLFEIVTEKDIRLVIAFSDGIGALTEQALTEAFKNAPDEIRKDIILHTQGTEDDKSICFLEIKHRE